MEGKSVTLSNIVRTFVLSLYHDHEYGYNNMNTRTYQGSSQIPTTTSLSFHGSFLDYILPRNRFWPPFVFSPSIVHSYFTSSLALNKSEDDSIYPTHFFLPLAEVSITSNDVRNQKRGFLSLRWPFPSSRACGVGLSAARSGGSVAGRETERDVGPKCKWREGLFSDLFFHRGSLFCPLCLVRSFQPSMNSL